jgi:RNA polymerase primary sigma factor
MVSPQEAVLNASLKEKTKLVLKTLTPREEQIIKLHFGLADGNEHTLEEVEQRFASLANEFVKSRQKLCPS